MFLPPFKKAFNRVKGPNQSIVGETSAPEAMILVMYGPKSCTFWSGWYSYHMTLDTPENKAYLQEWRKYYPDAPINYRYPDLATLSHPERRLSH